MRTGIPHHGFVSIPAVCGLGLASLGLASGSVNHCDTEPPFPPPSYDDSNAKELLKEMNQLRREMKSNLQKQDALTVELRNASNQQIKMIDGAGKEARDALQQNIDEL